VLVYYPSLLGSRHLDPDLNRPRGGILCKQLMGLHSAGHAKLIPIHKSVIIICGFDGLMCVANKWSWVIQLDDLDLVSEHVD
jgi:hypothetical protein